MADEKAQDAQPVTIKKYANRRLYNTATSSYVTLDHLCQMVKDGTDFVVYDAKTGEDITRSVLTQIIFEEEGKGHNLLPIGFLRQLISFYDDSLRAVLPSYLEMTMANFAKNQEDFRGYMEKTFGGLFPFSQFNEASRQNLKLFQNALTMFSPFAGQEGMVPGSSPGPNGAAPAAGDQDQIRALKDQLDRMQRQLDTLAGGNGGKGKAGE